MHNSVDNVDSSCAIQGIKDAVGKKDGSALVAALKQHPVYRCWTGGCKCDRAKADILDFYGMVSSLGSPEVLWLHGHLELLPKVLQESVVMIVRDCP